MIYAAQSNKNDLLNIIQVVSLASSNGVSIALGMKSKNPTLDLHDITLFPSPMSSGTTFTLACPMFLDRSFSSTPHLVQPFHFKDVEIGSEK